MASYRHRGRLAEGRRSVRSTHRFRVEARTGLVLSIATRRPPRGSAPGRGCIGNRRGNAKSDLGPESGLAPHVEAATDLLGALAPPVQAKVADRLVAPDSLLVEPLAIIVHADPKPPALVADLRGDVLCRRVSHGIAQRLSPAPIDLVAHGRLQSSRRTLYHDANRRWAVPLFPGQFGDDVPKGSGRIGRLDAQGSEPLHGMPGPRRRHPRG